MAAPSTSASFPAPASSAFPLAAAARFPRVSSASASSSSSTRALALAERRRLSEVGGGDRSVAAGRRSFHGLVPAHALSAGDDGAEGSSIKREAEERSRRRMLLAAGTAMFLSWPNPAAYAAEAKKGFLPVTDKKDGYSFLYPFGWQEVVVQGQDKVYKDVIEPLESVSVNTIPTSKQDIRELGPPDQVAEALIRKVLAAPTQKTKLIEAKENDVDGRTYYTFEFTAQAPNFTRHALGAIAIANGKFYTLTTGANERRWEKIKDRLHTVVDSFKIEARV
ncbi:psbP-like protein 1, chloroplastic [Oryza glaberrima]|uniref:psbP-like protein 1, chloroplastic n=1 Tax=Oryza glaberrima TaxID=4538 RepID=UPI00224C3372|nr:psbP-like protein 1, chloroplastic [Oryza glaberrima]